MLDLWSIYSFVYGLIYLSDVKTGRSLLTFDGKYNKEDEQVKKLVILWQVVMNLVTVLSERIWEQSWHHVCCRLWSQSISILGSVGL